jgi:hypothetical protein
VLIDGAGGSGTFTANVQNLNVNVTGDGFKAQNGVTLTAGGTNTITSATGVGLTLNNMAIDAAGANFQSVNVTAGATNGIVMTNVTGGQVAVTGTGTTANSGGALTVANDAVQLNNVVNVDIRNLHVVNAGAQGVNIDHTAADANAMDVTFQGLTLDAAGGAGFDVLAANNGHAFNLRLLDSTLTDNVVMSNTGTGAFGLLVDSTDITTTGTDVAFALSFSGSAQTGNVTIRNGNNFVAGDASALSIASSGAGAKTVNLLVSDSAFSNNSLSTTANFQSSGSTTLNATIQGNTFDDANAGGSDFTMASNGAAARIRLELGGATAADFNTAAGVGTFELFENGGSDFDIFERDDTFAGLRNNGTVDGNGGAYDNLAAPPPLPTVP